MKEFDQIMGGKVKTCRFLVDYSEIRIIIDIQKLKNYAKLIKYYINRQMYTALINTSGKSHKLFQIFYLMFSCFCRSGGIFMQKIYAFIVSFFVGRPETGNMNIAAFIIVVTALLIALTISIILAKKNHLYSRRGQKEDHIIQD